MKCSKCSTEAELKVFSSFQYYYCSRCKEEVKDSIPLEGMLDALTQLHGLNAWMPLPRKGYFPVPIPASNHVHFYYIQRDYSTSMDIMRCGCGHTISINNTPPPSTLSAPNLCYHGSFKVGYSDRLGTYKYCADCSEVLV